VFLADSESEVVGMIVAGAVPAYSIVQDLGFVLHEAGVTLG
jgi:hypothetical protein